MINTRISLFVTEVQEERFQKCYCTHNTLLNLWYQSFWSIPNLLLVHIIDISIKIFPIKLTFNGSIF